VIGTVLMSFDVWDTELPRIEIYGTEGTLSLPNPNFFDGNVRVKRHEDPEWRTLAPVIGLFGAPDSAEQLRRGLGVNDLTEALDGRPLRTDPQFAFHTLEVLTGIEASRGQGRVVAIESTCERPAPRY
jgi:predicted dehydrogenase